MHATLLSLVHDKVQIVCLLRTFEFLHFLEFVELKFGLGKSERLFVIKDHLIVSVPCRCSHLASKLFERDFDVNLVAAVPVVDSYLFIDLIIRFRLALRRPFNCGIEILREVILALRADFLLFILHEKGRTHHLCDVMLRKESL